MKAIDRKIEIKRGVSFDLNYTWKNNGVPVDLTGFTAFLKVATDFENKDGVNLITATTENGKITLGGTAGTVSILITAVDTAAIDSAIKTGVYDLVLKSSANIGYHHFTGKAYILDSTP